MREIGRAIPTLLILMIIEVVTMIRFILSAVPFEKIGSSFSHWITNIAVTAVTVSTVGILVVGVAIYFQHVCVCAAGNYSANTFVQDLNVQNRTE